MTIASESSIGRVFLADPATATNSIVQAVFGEIERELGFGIVPNIFRAMAAQPPLLRAVWDLFRITVLEGELPRAVKEMVGVVVSAANNSEYALKVHLHSLGVQGVTEETLQLLAAGEPRVTGVAPSVAAILQLAYTAARHGPLAVSDQDYARAEDAGVTQEELLEVFAAINLFQYVNSFTDLARVPVDAI